MLTDLDEALERLQQSDFECGDGSVNQGPMAVVALEALGHPSLIPFFTDVYLPRLRPVAKGTPIPDDARARALGDRARRADWLATFEGLLAEVDRPKVLDVWLPLLLPGTCGASGSGLLRTHAALVALESGEDAVRRRELAFGLAHWASRHQRLPGAPGRRPEQGMTIAAALAGLPDVASDRRNVGSMNDAVLVLEGDAGFASTLASIDLDAQPATEAIIELVCGVAALQLRHPEARSAYGHVACIAMALLDLASRAGEPDVVGTAAQIALAVHGVYGTGAERVRGDAADDAERDALAQSVDEIRYRAACSGQADSITIADAYLRAHRRAPRDVLLRAAADAALRFEAAHGGRGG